MLSKGKTLVFKTLAIIAALILILSISFKYCRMPVGNIRPQEALPSSAAIFLEVHHPDVAANLMDKAYFKDSMQYFYPVQKWREDYQLLEKIFSQYQQIDLLHKNTLYAALEKNGSSDVDLLFVLDAVSRKFKLPDYLQQFNKSLKFRQHSYQGCDVYQVRIDANRFFYLSQYRNLLLMGRHSFLVEDAISQLQSVSTNILRDPRYRNIDTLPDDPGNVNIFVQFERLPAMISSLLKTESYHDFDWLPGTASWLALNCRFNSNNIQTSGYIVPSRSQSFLSAIKKQAAGSADSIAQIIPDNTALLMRWNISDLHQFMYLVDNPTQKTFTEYFKPWLGKEIAYVMTEPLSIAMEAEKFAVAGIRDLAGGRKLLQKFAEKTGKIKEKDYQSFLIYELLEPGLFKPLLGDNTGFPDRIFFTLFNRHLVACGSQAALELWIDKYIAGQVLVNDPEYQSWSAGQYSYENILLYFKTARLEQVGRALIKPELNNAFQRQFGLLALMLQAGFQVHQDHNQLEVIGSMSFISERAEQTNVLWKTLLNATAAMKPRLIRHPKNGEYVIFIQDQLNQVYLISSSGELLYKRQLEEPVLSDIYLVDAMKNGAYSYLFNTKNFIYLIDNNGLDVNNYPFRLQSPATTGMTAISFDRKSYEHYFLPSENGNLYGFDIRNTPLPGWNPLQGVGKVHIPLLHFQQAGKDFIVAINDSGKLMAYKRDATLRFPPVLVGTKLKPPVFVQDYEPYPRIVIADSLGQLKIVNLTGQTFSLGMGGRSGKSVFCFADVTGDIRKDYISLTGNLLKANYYNNTEFKPFLNYDFKQAQDEVFTVRPDTLTKSMIGSLDRANKRIFLLNDQGKLYSDFPMSGTTAFDVVDLYNDRRKILVVAYENSVYAYQLR